jgi:pimeloyl-ACP methyl ester carboxylesterase
MTTKSNDGVAINFDVVGTGPVLVMHHGFFGSLYDWYEHGYVEALVQHFRLVLIDARGHGNSDKPKEASRYSLERHAIDVITVLDSLGVKSFHYLGFSMGARVGFTLAIHFPERLKQCICMADHPFRYSMKGIQDATLKLREWAVNAPMSNWQRARMLANDRDALLAACANDRPDQSDKLKSSKVSFLLVVGRQDDFRSVESASELIPNNKLVVIEEFSHIDILIKSNRVIPHVNDVLEIDTIIRDVDS